MKYLTLKISQLCPMNRLHPLVIAIALGVFALAAVTVASRGNGGRASRPVAVVPPMGAASSLLAVQNPPAQGTLDAKHITLRKTGFEPSEITHPAGRFLLAVDNLTEMGEMSYRLLDQTGAVVQDFPAKGRFRLRQVVDLPPGGYALVVINHPNWVCRFTITAP